MSDTALVERTTLPLQGLTKDGQSRSAALNATVIGIPKSIVNKATEQELAENGLPLSAADDDSEWAGILGGGRVVAPPYNLLTLALLKEYSTELNQVIGAMATNTVGFGFQLRERTMSDRVRRRFEDEIEEEKHRLKAALSSVHPLHSLTMIRKRVKNDQHSCGNGYNELVQNRMGQLVGVNHVHGHSIRIGLRTDPVQVDVPRVRPDLDFQIEHVPMMYRFRRYCQVRDSKAIWFKEAGDPRTMNRFTGEFVPEGKAIAFGAQATSLIHYANYASYTPYGVPLWIGNILSILGSRSAEEINYGTISNNNVPSMFVLVENGMLTEASINRLTEFVEGQMAGDNNDSKFILLEGAPLDEGGLEPGQFKINVQPMKGAQQQDELFQKYDANNRDKLRQSFRLPPIFVGRSDEYNRATADASRALADEQVFAPERDDDDHMVNRHVLMPMGARFHQFRSNHPNITDDSELVKMMTAGEKSGAMTPRRADRIMRDIFGDDIGPVPVGIDLDTPYSLQFAQAQVGQPGGEGRPVGQAVSMDATGFIDGLMDLRSTIEVELARRN
jgi:PBSX family phage portal protein